MGIERIVSLPRRRPAGYRAPYYGLSASTFDLLIEEGLFYNSSPLFADDVPIILESRLGRLVELPPPLRSTITASTSPPAPSTIS